MNLSKKAYLGLFLSAVIFAVGCSRSMSRPLSASVSKSLVGHWARARFAVFWPENTEPDWGPGALVTDKVLRPLLIEHFDKIPLWRVHKRALRDSTGNQFSFIFFASDSNRELVCNEIQEHEVISALKAKGVLNSVSCKEDSGDESYSIEGTSDRKWPKDLQRTWPYFAMGASATWMELLHEKAGAQGEGRERATLSLDETLGSYRKASYQASRTWARFGQHAYLHHLNAIFDYQPLILLKELNF